MEFINSFIQSCGPTIVLAILTWIAGIVGTQMKNIYESKINDDTKRKVVQDICAGIEQMYKNLNGEDKLNIAIQNITETLDEKGIKISEVEIRMLIEATVYSFKTSLLEENKKEEE